MGAGSSWTVDASAMPSDTTAVDYETFRVIWTAALRASRLPTIGLCGTETLDTRNLEPIADAVFQYFPKFRDHLRDLERRFNDLPNRPEIPQVLRKFGDALEASCRSRLMLKTVVEVSRSRQKV